MYEEHMIEIHLLDAAKLRLFSHIKQMSNELLVHLLYNGNPEM